MKFVGVVAISLSFIFFLVGVINLNEKTGSNVINTFVNGFLVVIVAFVP